MRVHWEGRTKPTNTLDELYGEVNSVKKHNYKIWLNDGVC